MSSPLDIFGTMAIVLVCIAIYFLLKAKWAAIAPPRLAHPAPPSLAPESAHPHHHHHHPLPGPEVPSFEPREQVEAPPRRLGLIPRALPRPLTAEYHQRLRERYDRVRARHDLRRPAAEQQQQQKTTSRTGGTVVLVEGPETSLSAAAAPTEKTADIGSTCATLDGQVKTVRYGDSTHATLDGQQNTTDITGSTNATLDGQGERDKLTQAQIDREAMPPPALPTKKVALTVATPTLEHEMADATIIDAPEAQVLPQPDPPNPFLRVSHHEARQDILDLLAQLNKSPAELQKMIYERRPTLYDIELLFRFWAEWISDGHTATEWDLGRFSKIDIENSVYVVSLVGEALQELFVKEPAEREYIERVINMAREMIHVMESARIRAEMDEQLKARIVRETAENEQGVGFKAEFGRLAGLERENEQRRVAEERRLESLPGINFAPMRPRAPERNGGGRRQTRPNRPRPNRDVEVSGEQMAAGVQDMFDEEHAKQRVIGESNNGDSETATQNAPSMAPRQSSPSLGNRSPTPAVPEDLKEAVSVADGKSKEEPTVPKASRNRRTLAPKSQRKKKAPVSADDDDQSEESDDEPAPRPTVISASSNSCWPEHQNPWKAPPAPLNGKATYDPGHRF